MEEYERSSLCKQHGSVVVCHVLAYSHVNMVVTFIIIGHLIMRLVNVSV
jgi:hypothetical protein